MRQDDGRNPEFWYFHVIYFTGAGNVILERMRVEDTPFQHNVLVSRAVGDLRAFEGGRSLAWKTSSCKVADLCQDANT